MVFNQPLDSWNVSEVTSLRSMFEGAAAFDQTLDNWDLSSLRDFWPIRGIPTACNHPLPFKPIESSQRRGKPKKSDELKKAVRLLGEVSGWYPDRSDSGRDRIKERYAFLRQNHADGDFS